MASNDNGVIFRLLPKIGVLPVFSLYSKDRIRPQDPPLIVRYFQNLCRSDVPSLITNLGQQLAGPFVRLLFAGFKEGYSLEMHAQNTLISLGSSNLIDRVFFRDLEGVVMSNDFRVNRGLQPKLENYDNEELHWGGKSMRRWFNRNIDHDLGRIFDGSLDALLRFGLLDEYSKNEAIQSIRTTVRHEVNAAKLAAIDWPGRLFPYSRAPWGSGLKPGHYFRTRFR